MGIAGALIGGCFGNRLFMRVKYLFQASERLGMQLSLGSKADMDMYDTYAKLKRVQ